MDGFKITKERHMELKQELKDRVENLRSEISNDVRVAKERGDLKENAEYHVARNRQKENESKIAEIEHILKHTDLIKKTNSEIVELGSTVVAEKQGGDKFTWQIVVDQEADISKNKLSHNSPIGAKLMGTKKGDEINIELPSGTVVYIIKQVS